jgi:hypothetical protein
MPRGLDDQTGNPFQPGPIDRAGGSAGQFLAPIQRPLYCVTYRRRSVCRRRAAIDAKPERCHPSSKIDLKLFLTHDTNGAADGERFEHQIAVAGDHDARSGKKRQYIRNIAVLDEALMFSDPEIVRHRIARDGRNQELDGCDAADRGQSGTNRDKWRKAIMAPERDKRV